MRWVLSRWSRLLPCRAGGRSASIRRMTAPAQGAPLLGGDSGSSALADAQQHETSATLVGAVDQDSRVEPGGGAGPEAGAPAKPQAARPTHFLSLQLSHSPSVVAAVEGVQASLLAHTPGLRAACVDAASAHVTLGVLGLRSAADAARAELALVQLGAVLAREGLAAPLPLALEGLSHFRNQVLFFEVRRGEGHERLTRLAAAARAAFQAAGVLLQADRPFAAHVTVAKMSKAAGGGRGRGRWRRGRRDSRAGAAESAAATELEAGAGGADAGRDAPDSGARWTGRSIPPEAWEAAQGASGGSALVTELQLCSMQGRTPGAYYQVAAALALGEGPL